MADDAFPNEVITYTRDEVVAKWQRDYLIRQPDADVGPGTQPFIDANVAADAIQVLHSDAVAIANNTKEESATGDTLEQILIRSGLDGFLPAAGASGSVTITASNGGANIPLFLELKNPRTNIRYQALAPGAYADGDPVPIVAIDTGPETNADPGTVLLWTSPTNGLGPTATVLAQNDGTGLSGGREREREDEARARLVAVRANPPASGNDAEYQQTIVDTKNIAVQAPFTYPADGGPGMTSVAFTLRPAKPGANRIPNLAQRTLVRARLEGAFPGDDGIFDIDLVAEPLAVVLAVRWRSPAPSWADTTPWPEWIPGDPIVVDTAVSVTGLGFRVTTATATIAPQVGQTIAVYDPLKGEFRPKRIATVTVVIANKSWDLTFDASTTASDTSYRPADGQIVSPWSDSIKALPAPVIKHVDGLGPGELYASFPAPGRRLRRQPPSPEQYPNELTNRVTADVQRLPPVSDANLLSPAVPFPLPVGVPRTLAYLFELADLAAFPQ